MQRKEKVDKESGRKRGKSEHIFSIEKVEKQRKRKINKARENNVEV